MISFIIPAHNAAETIERAILSIESLNVMSEIVVVENGSTDNTEKTVTELAKNYKNIVSLTSDQGVSKARNIGIKHAAGEWITFVDADDVCLARLEELLKVVSIFSKDSAVVRNENTRPEYDILPDIIVGSYKKDDDSITHDYKSLNTIIDCTDELKAWLISRPTLRMQAWAKLYRADFLKKNSLLFDEKLSYSEDSEFVIRALNFAKNIVVSDIPIYQYHSGTLSVMRGFVEGRINAYLTALEVTEGNIMPESQVVKQAFMDYVFAHINIIGVHDIFNCTINETWKNRCRRMEELMVVDVIRRAVNNKRFTLSLQTLPVMLCKHHLTVMGGESIMLDPSRIKSDTKELVSVIIPVYNVEDYIGKCIDSVVGQTYENIEIILVDDGSPDKAGRICDQFAEKDNRIAVYHKENGGLSDARNYGIDHANGEYYVFIDSDDYVDKNYIEYLVNLTTHYHCKLSICQHRVVFSNGTVKDHGRAGDELLYPSECLLRMLYHDVIDTSSWAKMYHRSLFENIRFPKGKIYEDIGTTYKFMLQCDRIAVGYESKYSYVYNNTSIVNGKFNEKKFELLEMTDQMAAEVNEKYPQLAIATERRRTYARFSTLNQMAGISGYEKEKSEIIAFIKGHTKMILLDKKAPIRDKIAMVTINISYKMYEKVWAEYKRSKAK